MNKNLKLMGGGFIYGLTHPFDSDLKGRPVDKLSIPEAMLDGAAGGLGQGITQGIIACGIMLTILVGIGFVDQKMNKVPVNVKTVIDKKLK